MEAVNPDGPPSLLCELYVGSEQVGISPPDRGRAAGKIALAHGESLVHPVVPGWTVKKPGRQNVELAFCIIVPGLGTEQDMMQMWTKPVSILFKNDESSTHAREMK